MPKVMIAGRSFAFLVSSAGSEKSLIIRLNLGSILGHILPSNFCTIEDKFLTCLVSEITGVFFRLYQSRLHLLFLL
jgi:hypothetical protein